MTHRVALRYRSREPKAGELEVLADHLVVVGQVREAQLRLRVWLVLIRRLLEPANGSNVMGTQVIRDWWVL